MRAAEIGWELYRDGDPRPTLEDVNEGLARRQFPPISTRMYDHYGRLVRHAFEQYIPINELDMFIKTERRRRKSA
jgi:hypothetical protein